MTLGNRVYGLAAIALGAIGLVWGDFATVWQPVPAETPGYGVLAYAAAGLLIAGGLAMLFRRSTPGGALVLASLYAVFALLWGRRVLAAPEMFGTWLGAAEQLALVVAGAVAAVGALPGEVRAGRMQIGSVAFGLCLLVFGAAHLILLKETAAFVPEWLPRRDLWAAGTGIADVLAGLALLSGIAAALASRLVVLMFIGFGALIWAPILYADPHGHIPLTGNAINLALVGAAWVLADSIARARRA